MPISFFLKDIEIDKKGRVVIRNKHLAEHVKELKKKGKTAIEADIYVDYTDSQCLCMCNCA